MQTNKIDEEAIKVMHSQPGSQLVNLLFKRILDNLHDKGYITLSRSDSLTLASALAEQIMDEKNLRHNLKAIMNNCIAKSQCENDAMIVMMLALGIVQADTLGRPGFDIKFVILRFICRWYRHPLMHFFIAFGNLAAFGNELNSGVDAAINNVPSHVYNELDPTITSDFFETLLDAINVLGKDQFTGILYVFATVNEMHGGALNKYMHRLRRAFGLADASPIKPEAPHTTVCVENVDKKAVLNGPNAVGFESKYLKTPQDNG